MTDVGPAAGRRQEARTPAADVLVPLALYPLRGSPKSPPQVTVQGSGV